MLAFNLTMPKAPLSVTIITLNEEKNLAKALKSVLWADDVVVVDCGSTDKTHDVARSFGARVLLNPWKGYGQQKNFAQSQARYDWVLNIDADEEVSPELQNDILDAFKRVQTGEWQFQGFSLPRRTYYLGRWIQHGGWYPNYTVRMADRRKAQWTEPKVHEELKVNGAVHRLSGHLNHYTFGSIQEQVITNLNFSMLGSQELVRRGQQANLLKLLAKPFGKFLETYIIKRGFMDGLAGLIISINAAHSMFLKYAYLFEEKIRQDQK